MLNGYQIIEADSHVYEPQPMWEMYLEPAFKSFAPSPDMKIKGDDIVYKVCARASSVIKTLLLFKCLMW